MNCLAFAANEVRDRCGFALECISKHVQGKIGIASGLESGNKDVRGRSELNLDWNLATKTFGEDRN
jgi:hypothetical protein